MSSLSLDWYLQFVHGLLQRSINFSLKIFLHFFQSFWIYGKVLLSTFDAFYLILTWSNNPSVVEGLGNQSPCVIRSGSTETDRWHAGPDKRIQAVYCQWSPTEGSWITGGPQKNFRGPKKRFKRLKDYVVWKLNFGFKISLMLYFENNDVFYKHKYYVIIGKTYFSKSFTFKFTSMNLKLNTFLQIKIMVK